MNATVEVLTAEVRTLMVGSRQVTLSVYRQLDEVEWKLIQPFGRVRSSKKPNQDTLELVGVSGGGQLVRSEYVARHSFDGHFWWDDPEPFGESTLDPSQRIRLNGQWLGEDVPEPLVIHPEIGWMDRIRPCTGRSMSPGWHIYPGKMDALRTEVLDALRKYRVSLATDDAMRSLPLIVLAGLR
jgi:hypothetical protein